MPRIRLTVMICSAWPQAPAEPSQAEPLGQPVAWNLQSPSRAFKLQATSRGFGGSTVVSIFGIKLPFLASKVLLQIRTCCFRDHRDRIVICGLQKGDRRFIGVSF